MRILWLHNALDKEWRAIKNCRKSFLLKQLDTQVPFTFLGSDGVTVSVPYSKIAFLKAKSFLVSCKSIFSGSDLNTDTDGTVSLLKNARLFIYLNIKIIYMPNDFLI